MRASPPHTRPIFTDDEDYPDHLATAAEVDRWWLHERRPGVAAAMTAIADAPSAPILVHCHAGKDRTGVVVALVLRLAGVSVDAIADDYVVSGVQLADMLARDKVTALERGMDAVRAERLFTVRREAVVQTMECVDTEHGGVVALLRGLGLDEARIARLTNLLLGAGLAIAPLPSALRGFAACLPAQGLDRRGLLARSLGETNIHVLALCGYGDALQAEGPDLGRRSRMKRHANTKA